MNRTILTSGLIVATALGGPAALADEERSFTEGAKDAWLTGRIESMYLLNEHLSPFAIDTDVDNGVVHLSGTVQSDIDKDLAGQLVRNLDGVVDVENELTVDTDYARAEQPEASDSEGKRDFGSWVDDATTTAAVKSRLIGNGNTKGLQIDVDTMDDIVTLSGRVESDAEKDLAEEIARGASDVAEVHNNLVVDPS
jgi:hyperosmotically inducible periplasmic protein